MADSEQAPETQNGPSQSRVVLARPRLDFGSSSFSTDTSKSSSSLFGSNLVLRPPQLKPTVSENPFVCTANVSSKDSSTQEGRLSEPSKDVDPPKFVPLGGSLKTSNPIPPPAQTPATSSSSGFVFGQNLSARVVVAEGINNGGLTDHSTTNGNSELLFTSAVASNTDNTKEEQTTESRNSGEGLAAAAAEYERSHARPLPLATPANTTTGEEEDTNVLQITCRLFAWEAGSWRERGRGVLRLNHCGEGARLVFRILGSFRVVLNTMVWGEMVNERAGVKSLRITATDAQNQVKVFLIMASPADISCLYRELTKRISHAKETSSSVDRAHQDYSVPPADHLPDEKETQDEEPEPTKHSDVTPDERGSEWSGEEDSNDKAENKAEESPNLKRKEAAEGEGVSPKRQCPEIVID